MEEAKVVLYLAQKSQNYDEVIAKSETELKKWQESGEFPSVSARDVLSTYITNSKVASERIIEIIESEICDYSNENIRKNLEFLSYCAKPLSTSPQLVSTLFNLLGSTKQPEIANLASQVIYIHLNLAFPDLIPFESWWKCILPCLSSTHKLQVSAGLRAWFACLTTSNYTPINKVIVEDGSNYFSLLQREISNASKYALQVLLKTLNQLEIKINNDFMTFDPQNPQSMGVWSRFASLIDILGIDTSLHQMADSLADLVGLMLPNSLLPPLWIITLLNVGMRVSNTEGIRVLTTQTVLCLEAEQMKPLVLNPTYVAEILYPIFLQTPSFVVINDQCLHAEHLEQFTTRYVEACFQFNLENNLKEFIYKLGCYFVEHSHSFEVPRVLIANVFLNTLPPNFLTKRETHPLATAAKASVLTYNSKAMADLNASLVEQVIAKAGDQESNAEIKPEDYNSKGQTELKINGLISPEVFMHYKASIDPQDLPPTPTRLMHAIGWMQMAQLANSKPEINVLEMLEREINTPPTLKPEERPTQAYALELALNSAPQISYDLCELIFQQFSVMNTRLAALRAFRRSKPLITFDQLSSLWTHIKDATLRILDRELHHEFIDLLTDPQTCECTSICMEIIELSLHRKNLLFPLAKGLNRHSPKIWVSQVMVEIFTFIAPNEYALKMEEMTANRFNVYELNWGRPDSHARAIAGYYLSKTVYADDLLDYVLGIAKLDTQITGSLNNIQGNKRVLYYQIIILIQSKLRSDKGRELLPIIKQSMLIEANPPVRVHAEWLIALLIFHHFSRNVEYVELCVEGLGIKDSTAPRLIGSLIRIGMLLYFAEPANSEFKEAIGESLVECIIPMATSNRAVVRHRSVSALYILNKSGQMPAKFKEIVYKISTLNAEGVIGSTYQNDSFLWDLLDTSLGRVFGGVVSCVYKRTMPQTLTLLDFEDVPKDAVIGECWEGEVLNPELPAGITNREKIIEDAVSNASKAVSAQIQTKSGSFEIEHRANRTELIVVASLCDKPVNQGAISRLCDALGVKLLALKDLSVLSDQNFKSTALTSEKWLPLIEVPESGVCEYLKTKKSEGYTLIGIEQTDTSKKLTSKLQFPERCVLIMGHEREGIPAEILALLNNCIEIEQRGYVRSMNIQTATAILVHAYNQQHSSLASKLEYTD